MEQNPGTPAGSFSSTRSSGQFLSQKRRVLRGGTGEARPRVARQEDLVQERVRFEIGQRWAIRCGVAPSSSSPQKAKSRLLASSSNLSLGNALSTNKVVGQTQGWMSASSSLSGRCEARCCAGAAAKRAVAFAARNHSTVAETLQSRDVEDAARVLGRICCDVFFGGDCRDASRINDATKDDNAKNKENDDNAKNKDAGAAAAEKTTTISTTTTRRETRRGVSLELLEDAAKCGCVLLVFCAEPAFARGLLRVLLAGGGLCDDPLDLAAAARASADLAVSRGVCAERFAPSLELFVATAARKAFVDAVPLDALVVCWDAYFDRVADCAQAAKELAAKEKKNDEEKMLKEKQDDDDATKKEDKDTVVKAVSSSDHENNNNNTTTNENNNVKAEEASSSENKKKDDDAEDKESVDKATKETNVVTPRDFTSPSFDGQEKAEVVTQTADDASTALVASPLVRASSLAAAPKAGVAAWVRCGVALLACSCDTVNKAAEGTGQEDGASVALTCLADLSRDADAHCLADEIDAMDEEAAAVDGSHHHHRLEAEAGALGVARKLIASRRSQEPLFSDDSSRSPKNFARPSCAPGRGLSAASLNKTRAALRFAARAVVEDKKSVAANISLEDVAAAAAAKDGDAAAATELFALAASSHQRPAVGQDDDEPAAAGQEETEEGGVAESKNSETETTTTTTKRASAATLDALAALLWLEAPSRSRLRACLAALDLNDVVSDEGHTILDDNARGLVPLETDRVFRLFTALVAAHRRTKRSQRVAPVSPQEEEGGHAPGDFDERNDAPVLEKEKDKEDQEEEDSEEDSSEFFLGALAFKFAALKLRPRPMVYLEEIEAALLSDPSVVAFLLDADLSRAAPTASWGWWDDQAEAFDFAEEADGDNPDGCNDAGPDGGASGEGATARFSRRSNYSPNSNATQRRPPPPPKSFRDLTAGCAPRYRGPQQQQDPPVKVPQHDGTGGCFFCRPPTNQDQRKVIGGDDHDHDDDDDATKKKKQNPDTQEPLGGGGGQPDNKNCVVS